MKTLTKIEYLRRWLKAGRSITPLQAIAQWKMTRLADAIYKLKSDGWEFETETIRTGKSIYARYKLKENESTN